MFKMGSHHPFGYLKHKLWPKEGPRVKFAVWLPTTKCRELIRFPYVHVTCDIPLESSRRVLQLCFRPCLNRRFEHKIMGPQSHENPNFGNFETPTWESWDKKNHLDVGLVEKHIVYYKGEGGGFPQVRAVVSLVSPICSWLILAPKVFQLCINHLLLVLCRSVWVVDACHSS